jgi:hypothetical protein
MDMNRKDTAMRDENGPVRSPIKARQGGGPQVVFWILVVSVALAVIVGAVLLSKPKGIEPESLRNNPVTSTPTPH